MINEAVQRFFHVKLFLYLSGKVIAIFLSIVKVIKHNKLAVKEVNKMIMKNFLSVRTSDIFFKYSNTWMYIAIGILIIPTIKSASAKFVMK